MAKKKTEILDPPHIDWMREPEVDDDGVQSTAGIGSDGKEYGDPLPMQPPIGYEDPPDLATIIATMIRRNDFIKAVDAEGFDTPEEADDFDIEDDPPDPETVWERYYEAKTNPPAPAAAPPASDPPSPVSVPPTTAAPGEGAVASPPPVRTEDP